MNYAQYRKYLDQARLFLESTVMERFTVANSTKCLLAPLIDLIGRRNLGVEKHFDAHNI